MENTKTFTFNTHYVNTVQDILLNQTDFRHQLLSDLNCSTGGYIAIQVKDDDIRNARGWLADAWACGLIYGVSEVY